MANLTYNNNGISFNNVTSTNTSGGTFIGKEKIFNKSDNNIDQATLSEYGLVPIVQALQIDWNGAQLKSGSTVKATLNTTGEMLSILQTAYNYATTYTGKTSLVSGTTELAKINGQSLKFGGSITIETGSDYTHPTFSGVTGSYGTSAAKTLTHGGTFNVPYITVNNNGHITAIKSYTLTLPAAQTTVTGNAGTATKLATARKLTIGSAAKTFDGSADVAWTIAEIGAATASHKHTYTEVGAAAANHTHTYSAVGAAAANHTHTYSAVGAAAKDHTHIEYANAIHEHSNYAIKSHASTATTYGVGTSANYGHLKISGSYATQTTAADIALSLGGAYNMYKAFVTRISELANEITALKTRVTTLEGYHATKPVTAVTVTPETYTLYGKGKTAKLSYSITPTDASNKSATWTSDKTAYVTVGSTTGVVTTVAIGSATIKATAQDGSGKYDTCAVTVKEARIASFSVSDISATYGSSISRIIPTQTVQSGDGTVFNVGYTYTLKSGSTSVSVNNGELKINSAGTSYIIVTSKADTTKTKEVKVTVNKANQTPTINGTTTVTVGSTTTLTGSGQGTKTWSSNNTGVATVNPSTGVVTGVSYGTATITLRCAGNTNYNEGTKTATVTVNRISQTVSINKTSLSLTNGSTYTLTYSDAKTAVTWSSSNTGIATVGQTTGIVTAKGVGTATITATAAQTGTYSSATKECSVTVTAPAVKYYWYAGWTIPTAENIATIINEEYPTAGGSTTNNKAGKTATSISGVTMDYTKNTLYNSAAKINYYVVVPNGQSIYDVLGTNVVSSQFTSHSTFTNHTVYKSTATSRNINAIIIR